MYRSNMYEPTVAGLQPFSLVKSAKFGIHTGGFCFMAPTPDSPLREEDSPTPAPAQEGQGQQDEKKTPTAEVDTGVSAVTESLTSWSEDIECVDVSDIVKSHADYPNQVGRILEFLKLEPPSPMTV
jgi:hypothetical protein